MLTTRQFPRLDKKWQLSYKGIDPEKLKDNPVPSISVNISGGGICFESDEDVADGTMLSVELESEDFSSPIIALAKAAWCKKKRWHKDKYEVGAEFWWIGWKDNEAQQTVADYIKKEQVDKEPNTD